MATSPGDTPDLSCREGVLRYTVEDDLWKTKRPEATSPTLYRSGLCAQMNDLMKATNGGAERTGEKIEKTLKAACELNQGLRLEEGKGALRRVLKSITTDNHEGSPLVDTGSDDYGCAPFQEENGRYAENKSKIVFNRQPLATMVQTVWTLYSAATRFPSLVSTSPRGIREGAMHQYLYLFKGTPSLFVADIDARCITQGHLYAAITAFRREFRQALVNTLHFSQELADAAMSLMGTYESCTLEQQKEAEEITQGTRPDYSRKRSLHIHCHFLGPVAKSIVHFQAWIYNAVLVHIPLQYRTLFDLKVYRNGAFRSLGCCKQPTQGKPSKWLHPRPLPVLSGEVLCELWDKGEKGDDTSVLWLLATSHPAVIHDNVLPRTKTKATAGEDGPTFVPTKGELAKPVIQIWNKQRDREEALHWKGIVDDNLDRAAKNRGQQAATEAWKAKQDKLQRAYQKVALQTNRDGTSTTPLPPDKLKALMDKGNRAVLGFLEGVKGFTPSLLDECSAEHYERFYNGEYNETLEGLGEGHSAHLAHSHECAESSVRWAHPVVDSVRRADPTAKPRPAKQAAVDVVDAGHEVTRCPQDEKVPTGVFFFHVGRGVEPTRDQCAALNSVDPGKHLLLQLCSTKKAHTLILREMLPEERAQFGETQCAVELPEDLKGYLPTSMHYAPETERLRANGVLYDSAIYGSCGDGNTPRLPSPPNHSLDYTTAGPVKRARVR